MIIALAIAWLCGVIVWTGAVGLPRRGYQALAAFGFGSVIGLLVVTCAMRVTAAFGAGISLTLDAIIALGFSIALAAAAAALRRRGSAPSPLAPAPARLELAVTAGVVALLAWRFWTIASETLTRPVYASDALRAWAPRARVWFERADLVPFVDPSKWVTGAPDAYASAWHFYPKTVPLIQTWTALGIGSWEEPLTYGGWLLAWMAIGAAFYGQAVRLGASMTLAAVGAYAALSLPLISTHVALAGYADMWVATVGGLGVMALAGALVTGNRGEALIAALLLLAMPSIKIEGWIWSGAFAASLVAAALPPRLLLRGAGAAAAVLFLVLALGSINLTLPSGSALQLTTRGVIIPGIMTVTFEWHDSTSAFFQWLVAGSDWHLLWVLLPALWIASHRALIANRTLRPLFFGIGTSIASLVVLFYGTENWRYAENGSTLGRLALQLAPMAAFVTLLLVEAARAMPDDHDSARRRREHRADRRAAEAPRPGPAA